VREKKEERIACEKHIVLQEQEWHKIPDSSSRYSVSRDSDEGRECAHRNAVFAIGSQRFGIRGLGMAAVPKRNQKLNDEISLTRDPDLDLDRVRRRGCRSLFEWWR
jgi:hypothetical protein